MQKPVSVIFFGMSGAGKGTQARLLVDYLKENDPERGVLYLQTGQLLREFAGGESITARKVKEVLDNGGLMPTFMPIYLWTKEFIERFTGAEHIVLDGLARRVFEVPVLANALRFYGRNDAKVIVLNISRETALKRLLARDRYDDTEENIRVRIDWYQENVVPAIDSFRNETDLEVFDIDGEADENEIARSVRAALGI